MKVDQVRDSVNCRVDEVRYFVKIVDVVRVDQVRVDQVGCSREGRVNKQPVYPQGSPFTTDIVRILFRNSFTRFKTKYSEIYRNDHVFHWINKNSLLYYSNDKGNGT